MGRQNMSQSPGGTIARTVYNSRGLADKIYVGTNDTGATDSDPTKNKRGQDSLMVISSAVLVTSTEYNDDGEAFKTIDPAGKEDRTEFDDAGRPVTQTENYTDGDPTTGGNDEHVTVALTYTADGQRAKIPA